MPDITSSSSTCHNLALPPSTPDARLALNVRTGCAATLSSSTIVVHGGLVVALDVHSPSIEDLLLAHAALNLSTPLHDSLSGELFSLSLIGRAWSRIVIKPTDIRPCPRLFHEVCAINSSLLLFGGLHLSNDTLVPCNDLWEFNFNTKAWTLLHDGLGWEHDPHIPCPRFSHKLTLVSTLAFAGAPDHFGLIIAGGKDSKLMAISSNAVFDLVSKTYVKSTHFSLDQQLCRKDSTAQSPLRLDYQSYAIVNYTEDSKHSNNPNKRAKKILKKDATASTMTGDQAVHESLIIYTPSPDVHTCDTNPLVSFELGKSIKEGRSLPLYKKQSLRRLTPDSPYEWVVDKVPVQRTLPHNLQLPTSGVFGQNIVVTGYLPSEQNLAVFVFNIPTGKWLRLSLFCNHNHDTHRLWGGFVWLSHHKVVLLGKRTPAQTSSSVRFFSVMLTISLPVINLLANSELAGCNLRSHVRLRLSNAIGAMLDVPFDRTGEALLLLSDKSACSSFEHAYDNNEEAVVFVSDSEDDTVGPILPTSIRKPSLASGEHNAISFNDYVHYVAPKTNFTKIRLVLPPAAITLGRNAFTRYGEQLSDLELISSNGDRIPVAMQVLMERWGPYFIRLLASAYVQAVAKFESGKPLGGPGSHKLRTPSHDDRRTLAGSDPKAPLVLLPEKSRPHAERAPGSFTLSSPSQKDRAPKFRLPFQDTASDPEAVAESDCSKADDPWSESLLFRKSHMNNSSFLVAGHAPDDMSNPSGDARLPHALGSMSLPPQLAMPAEPAPAVPLNPTLKPTSYQGSCETSSSRSGSVLEALTALRYLPALRSPRHSVSHKGSVGSVDSAARHTASVVATAGNLSHRGSHTVFDAMDTLDMSADLSNFGGSPFLPAADINPKTVPDREQPSLLDFTNASKFNMESFLIPRKLYMPFNTTTIKCFSEFMYTGQIGTKWLLSPTTLENLMIAKFFNVPLLYDLVLEILFGIIGRKAAYILKEGNKLKHRYYRMLDITGTMPDPNVTFPLDEFEGFLDTVDDGYMDVVLLGKCSNIGVHNHDDKHKRLAKKRGREPGLRNPFSKNPSSDGATHSDQVNAETSNSDPKSPRSRVPENQDKKMTSHDESVPSGLSDESFSSSLDSDESILDVAVQFLDARAHDREQDPRATSVFDAEHMLYPGLTDSANADPDTRNSHREKTLEDLVSRDAPAPDDFIIDAIYEALTVVLDMKLIVRSMTVLRMSKIYAQSRAQVDEAIAFGMEAYEHMKADPKLDFGPRGKSALRTHASSLLSLCDRTSEYSRRWRHASDVVSDTALTIKGDLIERTSLDPDMSTSSRLTPSATVTSQKMKLSGLRASFLPLTLLSSKKQDYDANKQTKNAKSLSGNLLPDMPRSKGPIRGLTGAVDFPDTDLDVSSFTLDDGQTAQERNRRHHKFLSLFKFKDQASGRNQSVVGTGKRATNGIHSSASSVNSSSSRLSRIKLGFWHKH